jgi:hypothetical protein
MGWIETLKSRFTMVRQETLFHDKVNGKAVSLYKDCFGKKYMAQSKFSTRIERT